MRYQSPSSKCKNCGKTFWRLTPDGHRAVGSLAMLRIDPRANFCKLRCAAAYGVKAVEGKA